jgi:hypothetical protein
LLKIQKCDSGLAGSLEPEPTTREATPYNPRSNSWA